MALDHNVCEQARQSRDRRFDGQFIVAVVTTGIFCRPICPARMPAKDNVRFYPTAAAAAEHGYRPCLRCRPESAPRLPEWTLASDLAQRGLRLIDAGYLDEATTGELATRLGVSARHLDRVFLAELGTTPDRMARSRRVLLAKRLLTETRLPMTAVAQHAGFGSVRRFNTEMRAAYRMPPSKLRRSRGLTAVGAPLQLRLPVRQPYCAAWVFSFLEQRSLPGIETVSGYEYRRHLPGQCGFTVRWSGTELVLEIDAQAFVAGGAEGTGPGLAVSELLPRVRCLFDLDADSETIDAALAAEPRFRAQLQRSPGLRVPGAWDGFEIAVRAILGQQVSVARARDLAVALCQQFGGGLFPTARQLRDADVSAIGMPGKRGAAVRALATAVADQQLMLDEHQDNDSLVAGLVALPGIGPWTAGYVAMRVGRDPDAFADADWVLLKQLQQTAAQARKTALAWRPWRAYALMVLWAQSANWSAAMAAKNKER
ncbi:MAG: DNA-3-methyladenine glycosylase 2 family protein [Pseudomonadales bacterium]